MAAKKAARAPKAVAAPPEQPMAKPKTLPDLKGATAMHFAYHPEQKIVRINVQQTLTILGEKQRQGRDIDIAEADLDADILNAIKDAFGWLAEDVGATPYKAPKQENE